LNSTFLEIGDERFPDSRYMTHLRARPIRLRLSYSMVDR